MDENSKTFVVYVAFLNLTLEFYLDRTAQIASLLAKDVKISDKYSDFANLFSKEKTLILPKCTKLNKYAIDPEDGKQPSYGPVYSLDPVESETLKTYIKTHLKTGFMQSSKSLIDAPILFDKKPNNSVHLYMD